MEMSASSSSSSSSSSSKPSWNHELHGSAHASSARSHPQACARSEVLPPQSTCRSESTSSACSTASTASSSEGRRNPPTSPFSEGPEEEEIEEPKGSILYRPMGSGGCTSAGPSFDEKVDTDILCIWEPPSSCSIMDLLSEQASSLRLHDSHEAEMRSFDFRSVGHRAKSEPSFRQRRPPPLDECFFPPPRPRLHDRQQKNDNSRRRSNSRSRSRSRSRSPRHEGGRISVMVESRYVDELLIHRDEYPRFGMLMIEDGRPGPSEMTGTRGRGSTSLGRPSSQHTNMVFEGGASHVYRLQ